MRPAPVHEGSGRLLQTMSARGAERVTAEVLPSIDVWLAVIRSGWARPPCRIGADSFVEEVGRHTDPHHEPP